jgi:hypothetical protein
MFAKQGWNETKVMHYLIYRYWTRLKNIDKRSSLFFQTRRPRRKTSFIASTPGWLVEGPSLEPEAEALLGVVDVAVDIDAILVQAEQA